MPSTIAHITHIIFDFDGVILDTEHMYSVANDKVLQTYGRRFNNDLKAGMMGRKKHEGVGFVLEQTGLAGKVTYEEYAKKYDAFLDDLLPESPIMAGVLRLVNHIKEHKIPVAICTGSDTTEFRQKTPKYQEFLKGFTPIVLAGSDPDVHTGKPAPDPYLVTIKRFAQPPKSHANVLVFEDSINGVRSALAAGCTTVFIPQEEFKTADWEERVADIKPRVADLLSSLEQFVPEKYGLPPFKN